MRTKVLATVLEVSIRVDCPHCEYDHVYVLESVDDRTVTCRENMKPIKLRQINTRLPLIVNEIVNSNDE